MKILLKIKTYLVIIFLSILVTLYIFESYLIFNLNKPQINISKIKKIYEKNNNKKFDERSKYQIYKDLSSKDKNIVVSVSPFAVNDPENKIHFLAGVSNSQTIDCNENGYFSIYKSDRFGFNNPDDQWDKKKLSFLLLGDSFTHGSCVNRPKDIASILRRLSKDSVLNLGYKANGPLSMLATLKEYFPANTKNIIWLYYEGNDLEDLNKELSLNILKNYYFDTQFSQDLKHNQSYIDVQNKKIITNSIYLEDNIRDQAKRNYNFKNKILKFLRLDETKNFFYSVFSKKREKKLPFMEFKNTLKMAKDFSESKGSKFYFVYLPQFERYNKKFDNSRYQSIKSILSQLNVNLIDLHEGVFSKEKEPLDLFPFKMWGHYNEIGYEKITKYIFSTIKRYEN